MIIIMIMIIISSESTFSDLPSTTNVTKSSQIHRNATLAVKQVNCEVPQSNQRKRFTHVSKTSSFFSNPIVTDFLQIRLRTRKARRRTVSTTNERIRSLKRKYQLVQHDYLCMIFWKQLMILHYESNHKIQSWRIMIIHFRFSYLCSVCILSFILYFTRFIVNLTVMLNCIFPV